MEPEKDREATEAVVTEERLISALEELEEEVEKQNSLKFKFLGGALYGFGTVIGATVLLALFGSAVAITIRFLGIEHTPVIGNIVESLMIE